MRAGLERLFRPASVAVVGASDRPGSYGHQTLVNLAAIGYPGEVWGVNPYRATALGRPCVPTVADLPVAVDAVVVAIPAAGVVEVIEQAGARGCGGAVVFSAGFREVAHGDELQRDLVAAADQHGLPVCGPNGNGIVSMHARVALWGDALVPREPGPVALVSQSGNVAVNALASRRGLRLHTVVAGGNHAVLSAADYLEFLATEEDVSAIALYLEEDGGPAFCDGLAVCAEAGIPLAVLKVGCSEAGAASAAAHTAALAGDQRVFRALVEEAGAAWADDVHELLELAKAMAVGARPTGNPGLAIMTCSGGDSAQGADEAQRRRLRLPSLAPDTRERLARSLPAAATVANPLDYTSMIWGHSDSLGELVVTLGEDPQIGQILVFYDQPPDLTGAAESSWRAVREGIIAGATRSGTPTMVCSTLPELLDDEAAWRFVQVGIPAVAGLRTGLRCVEAMVMEPGDPRRLREMAALARSIGARSPDGEWISESESKELLRGAGIDVVAGRVVRDEQDVAAAVTELGGRIALKVSAVGLRHKSELAALALGLDSVDRAVVAHRRLSALAAECGGTVLAEEMIEPGVELLVAATVDAVVPAVVIGMGGMWTEVLTDVVVVPLPASAARIERALRSLRGAPLLFGERGQPPVDVEALSRLAERTGEALLEASLALVELNPVLVGERGAVAVDAVVRRRGPALSATTVPRGLEAVQSTT
ncbi:MAG: acetate--CoA ligase family protein [Solirubrobacterales bacterium]|nr:acetate--CoA ligase family protein [Solirubrobacterales bacterium]MBV9164987.1 acetate--CoA ligase family protein [Solirubrobacterales bacterium]MBV9534146.1 acetate--CoA ligase family protein [Solirubrobacterales bacterium]